MSTIVVTPPAAAARVQRSIPSSRRAARVDVDVDRAGEHERVAEVEHALAAQPPRASAMPAIRPSWIVATARRGAMPGSDHPARDLLDR